MTDAQRPAGGLRIVLLATGVAGGIGYLIQALIPPFLTISAYLSFTTFWSATYLVVSCLSGIQQELTRASRADDAGGGYRLWRFFSLLVAICASAAVVVLFTLIGPRVFPNDTVPLVASIAVAAFGYALVAAISGGLYGVQDWVGAGGMTVSDSVIRACAIGVALLAGGNAVLLSWSVSLPFLLAALMIWLWRGNRVARRLHLDVALPALFRNTSATILASLATGVLISGLPLLLRAFASDAGSGLLASVILVISLTRAPLVVPLVALQGYLLVLFRDQRSSVRAIRWISLLLACVVILAALAAWLGPVVMSWLYPSFSSLEGWFFGVIVTSAGLTGVLCITGPAVLAESKHRWYVAGWTLSALVTVGVLLTPFDAIPRILVALVVSPIAGAAVHAVCLVRTRAAKSTSAPT